VNDVARSLLPLRTARERVFYGQTQAARANMQRW